MRYYWSGYYFFWPRVALFFFSLLGSPAIALLLIIIIPLRLLPTGRLTSAWNWCSRLEKKPYYEIFMLAGFQGFDGSFKA